MNIDSNIKSRFNSTYKKDTIDDFLNRESKSKVIDTFYLNNLTLKLYSRNISTKSIKIQITTSKYTASLINKRNSNINMAIIIIMLQFAQQKFDWKHILDKTKQRILDARFTKLINRQVYSSVMSFMPDDINKEVINDIGRLLDYYYFVKI